MSAVEPLGKRIRRIRLERGLSQQLIADVIGCSRTQVTNIEAGRCAPTLDAFALIAAELDVSMDHLYWGES